MATLDTQLLDISTNKAREISITITLNNNTYTRQRTLIVPESNPRKRLHRFHQRNQVHLLTLSCIFLILKYCKFAWGAESSYLIKLNELISPPQNHQNYVQQHSINYHIWQNHLTKGSSVNSILYFYNLLF